jgi:hypothetical protein
MERLHQTHTTRLNLLVFTSHETPRAAKVEILNGYNTGAIRNEATIRCRRMCNVDDGKKFSDGGRRKNKQPWGVGSGTIWGGRKSSLG